MDYRLKFGTGEVSVSIGEKPQTRILMPQRVPSALSGTEELRRALEHPIGSPRLKDIVRRGERIAIITSDITRPLPSKLILPLVLAELEEGGVDLGDVTVVFALGIHRRHTEEERRSLVGEEVYRKVRCIDSNPDDCIRLGVCSNGTPVDVFSEVARADRRICLGNTEYHYFAGYSGGLKAIMPGVSSREAIQKNHSNMVSPGASAGNLKDNPVRNDIDEVARFLRVDFICAVVLDEGKNILKAMAGDCLAAHRASCQFLDSINMITVDRKADIVIVSAGGYPKDINLYQAQKAIDNAKYVVRDGGIIILVAACTEGLGEKVFERWILEYETPEERIDRIREHFELGGHKAAAIALVQMRAKIFMVSALEERLVRKAAMLPFAGVQDALNRALEELGSPSLIYIMPLGGATLPRVRNKVDTE